MATTSSTGRCKPGPDRRTRASLVAVAAAGLRSDDFDHPTTPAARGVRRAVANRGDGRVAVFVSRIGGEKVFGPE
jgi:hypothetical protein